MKTIIYQKHREIITRFGLSHINYPVPVELMFYEEEIEEEIAHEASNNTP